MDRRTAVAFSFFRKNQDQAAKPAPRSSSVARSVQPVSTKPVPPAAHPSAASTPARPEVEMLTTIGGILPDAVAANETHSVVEESAVLYASNYSDQAAALLLDYIRSFPERPDAKPWLMLFEVFQIQGEKPQFEELALEFVVKFERTAPIWSDAKVLGIQAEKSKEGVAVEGYIALTGILQGDRDSLFQNLEQVAQKGAGLRLDFARLEGLDASGSRRLAETLQGLKKSGKKITPVSVPHVTGLLKSKLGQGGEDEQAHWLLLLSLYQCLGMQAEFEDLAVEYAIAFEVSPPSWEAMPQCRQPAAVVTANAPDEQPHDENTFYMSGVISSASGQQLQELANFAATRSEVYLDMSAVPRVDFVSAGDFISVLVRLNGSGKKLLIRNANEMIRGLFDLLGVDQFAAVLKRKIG
jgi:anti-anti-sigma regulatory factor